MSIVPGHPRTIKNYWKSTCAYRVRMVMAYKGLDYNYEAVNLLKSEDDAPEYWKVNPSGVPTLIEPNGKVFTQSLAIMEYLEEMYPEHPVLPKDPADRCLVRALALQIISGIQPLQNMGVAHLFKQCGATWPAEKKNIEIGARQGDVVNIRPLRDIIHEGMLGLDNLMSRTAGTHCFGDSFTIADACLVPQADAARRSFGMDMSVYPTIHRVLQTIENLDCAKSTFPDVCPDATNYHKKAEAAAEEAH